MHALQTKKSDVVSDIPRTIQQRLVVLEIQIARLVSDADSEKETRRRVNIDISDKFKEMHGEIRAIETRVRHLERGMYVAMGALGFLQIALQLWNHHGSL